VRIESVRFDASGNPTIVVTGGISFFIPFSRAPTLLGLVDGGHQDIGAGMTAADAATRSFLQRLPMSSPDFMEEDEIYQALVSIDEECRARRKALELCARAEQSSAGLQVKLIAKGFSRRIAMAVIRALVAEGIVDDTRYARAWARGLAERRAAGPALLAAELRSRGQGEDAVRAALEDVDFSRALARAAAKERARLAAAWRKKGREPNARFNEELYRILKRQGFDADKIMEEIKKM